MLYRKIQSYIENHFADILAYENVIEHRFADTDLTKEDLIAENEYNLAQCKNHNLDYILIDNHYDL